MRAFQQITKEINEWQAQVFKKATADSAARHLLREAKELVEEPENGEEMADIFLLLAGVAYLSGVDLESEIEKKMAINRARTWREPDAEGVVEHVE